MSAYSEYYVGKCDVRWAKLYLIGPAQCMPWMHYWLSLAIVKSCMIHSVAQFPTKLKADVWNTRQIRAVTAFRADAQNSKTRWADVNTSPTERTGLIEFQGYCSLIFIVYAWFYFAKAMTFVQILNKNINYFTVHISELSIRNINLLGLSVEAKLSINDASGNNVHMLSILCNEWNYWAHWVIKYIYMYIYTYVHIYIYVYIYIYIKWTVFVNVTTKSAQHAHAQMIAIIVEKSPNASHSYTDEVKWYL